MDDDQARWYDETSQNGKLSSQVYVLGAYNFDLLTNLSCEANIFLKSASGTAPQTDIGMKLYYNELLWAGVNTQLNNDMSTMSTILGFNLNDRYTIGYSYGLPSTNVSSYYTGTHEFMLAVKILE